MFRQAVADRALVSLYRMVMESSASEQSARYRAMDSATSNLARLIEELTLAYHTARQHAITMEMLDLIGGTGGLRGPGAPPR
jgi:F-type H+-transporting ATPase subunit gamma